MSIPKPEIEDYSVRQERFLARVDSCDELRACSILQLIKENPKDL